MQQHKTPAAGTSKRKSILVKTGVFVFMLTLGYLVGGGIAKSIRHFQSTEQSSTTR
jgi:hypothetical protein